MKLKGKVKDLVNILQKSSCNGIFDPITYEFKDGQIITKMYAEGQLVAFLGKFNALDIEAEKDEKLIVNATDLMEQLKPMSGNSDFVMEKIDNILRISNSKETINFKLDEERVGQTIPMTDIPFQTKKDSIYFRDKELTTNFKVKIQELRELMSRRDIIGVKYVKLDVTDNNTKGIVGDMKKAKYHSRDYNIDGEIQKTNNESIEIAFGFAEIVDVLSGEIDIHFAENTVLSVFDKTEDYKVVYTLAPVDVIE